MMQQMFIGQGAAAEKATEKTITYVDDTSNAEITETDKNTNNKEV